MYLRIYKTRDVKTPTRSHIHDGGIDFYVPNDIEKDSLVIEPNKSLLLDSGIKTEIPPGFVGIFFNKSKIVSQKRLVIGSCVVDAFYSGNIKIDLHNIGKDIAFLEPGQKIIQMLIMPVVHCAIEEIKNENDLYKDFVEKEYRKEGGFGSTGDK